IIPILGPWLGGIPAVIIALTDGWQKAAFVVGFIVILQFLENMVLVPRVMRGAVGLTPLTVFVAVLAGTSFFGLAGAVLAIPIAALIQVLLTDFLDTRRLARSAPSETLAGWRWMRGALGAGQPVRGAEASRRVYPDPPTNGEVASSIESREATAEEPPPEPETSETGPATPGDVEASPADPPVTRRGPSWSRDFLQRSMPRGSERGEAEKPGTSPPCEPDRKPE
ncbi:MAG: AI-2E family transporter, partial [Thermomicrobiales bacterium]